MASESTFVNIIAVIIILHLVVGFGFLVYKLSGPPLEEKKEDEDKQ